MNRYAVGELVAEMRAAGVRRVKLAADGSIDELELEPAHDTIPAPAFELDVEPEAKSAGTCAHGGCQERAGFHFAPHLCERHGLGEFGVKT